MSVVMCNIVAKGRAEYLRAEPYYMVNKRPLDEIRICDDCVNNIAFRRLGMEIKKIRTHLCTCSMR